MALPPYRTITLLIHAGAGSGTGSRFAPQVSAGVQELFATAEIEVIETKSKEHIESVGLATAADLVICLSGDGSVHTLAQALMRRPQSERPTLAVIPVGSGNDYARTLGIPLDPLKALAELPNCVPIEADVGRVIADDATDDEAVYFLETMSFGVDAAVALKTEELRQSTKTRGFRLYTRAAVDAILHELTEHTVQMRIADQTITLDILILAVQNGPTYGSGYRVAPRASITDGILDICALSGIRKPTALYYLTRMKNGSHEKLKGISLYRSSRLDLEFTEQLPIQCDGERVLGKRFAIEVVPAALTVLAKLER